MVQKPYIYIVAVLFVACTTKQKSPDPNRMRADTTRTSKPKVDNTQGTHLTKAQKDSAAADSIAYHLIGDTIFALPEIEKFSHELDSESHDSVHAEMIYDPPSPNAPYYWVHVGYSNTDLFQTHFHFHIIIKGKAIKEIKYYDVVNDTDITLAAWRKARKEK